MSGKIYKPKPISGFPEWLPEERLVEQKWFDHIRRVFESYGYCSIETPSVEEIDVLLAKGEVDKEIYEIRRLHADENDKEGRLALHFDQTVPFARYTAQHFNDLVFPFKRYQMQRVWRGERPQMGRMREFYQCDIDVINVDNLPLSFDAEVAAVMYEVLDGLGIGKVQLRISNRKILAGLLEGTGIDHIEAFRVIDKREKMTEDEFTMQLLRLTKESAVNDIVEKYNILSQFILDGDNFKDYDIDVQIDLLEKHSNRKNISELARQGTKELSVVLKQLRHLPKGSVRADFGIVRGLDYYTGTVYETQLLDVPEFTGSVCSGGRYDDLASQYINKKLPGVGISIGFSRLFDVIRQSRPDLLQVGAKSPADVMMVLPSEEMRNATAEAARALRHRGIKVEVYHAPQKIGKQMSYAEKKGIPYVWFPPFESGNDHEVKNMRTGEQKKADPQTWSKE